jgi:hypothetical protein
MEDVKWSKCGNILDRRSGVKFVPPIISVIIISILAERTKKGMPCKKFATLRLFVLTMPI